MNYKRNDQRYVIKIKFIFDKLYILYIFYNISKCMHEYYNIDAVIFERVLLICFFINLFIILGLNKSLVVRHRSLYDCMHSGSIKPLFYCLQSLNTTYYYKACNFI